MLLTKPDFEEAENNKSLIIHDRQDFDDFTLDLRVDRLFRLKKGVDQELILSVDRYTFMNDCIEEISFNDEIELSSNHPYYFTPVETISSDEEYRISVYSKSSHARIGLRSHNIPGEMIYGNKLNEFLPLIYLTVNNTMPVIKKHKAIAHMIAEEGEFGHVRKNEIEKMLSKDELVLRYDGKPIPRNELYFHPTIEDGIILFRSSEISLYNGNPLIPGNVIDEDFTKISLSNEGISIGDNQFYLSSSKEEVEIPNNCVGFVKEFIIDDRCVFASHANAPLIGPKSMFKGVITFENNHIVHGTIYANDIQSVLTLRKLKTPIENGNKSRYNNQKTVQLSK
ncbi:hypothetical protein ACFLTH_11025 [Bacteroidota bacterium]